MKAVPVQAHQIASIGSARSSDGQFGLIRFTREKPLENGQSDVWMAVPTKLLPYLAVTAVKALPQPGTGGTANVPFALATQGAEFGVGANGEIVLTVGLEKGATLSFQLDQGLGKALLADLEDAIHSVNGTAPKSKSTKSRKNGKGKG